MTGKLKTRRWDVLEHLKTEEEIQGFLQACFEEAGDDLAFIAQALGDVARARGMTQLAQETGLARDTLYKALSGEGNPSFGTVLKVARALGFRMVPQAIREECHVV
jgi:probable addiction module antidote protein